MAQDTIKLTQDDVTEAIDYFLEAKGVHVDVGTIQYRMVEGQLEAQLEGQLTEEVDYVAECRELGFYCVERPGTHHPVGGWFWPCTADYPGAREDLNRLARYHARGNDSAYEGCEVLGADTEHLEREALLKLCALLDDTDVLVAHATTARKGVLDTITKEEIPCGADVLWIHEVGVTRAPIEKWPEELRRKTEDAQRESRST